MLNLLHFLTEAVDPDWSKYTSVPGASTMMTHGQIRWIALFIAILVVLLAGCSIPLEQPPTSGSVVTAPDTVVTTIEVPYIVCTIVGRVDSVKIDVQPLADGRGEIAVPWHIISTDRIASRDTIWSVISYTDFPCPSVF